MVMLVATVVLLGCGSAADTRPSFVENAETSSGTDSSPGETSNLDGEVFGESVIEKGQDLMPDPSEESDANSSSDTDDDEPTVKLGSSVLIGKDFVYLAGRKVGVIASTASVGPEGHIVDVLFAAPDVDVVAIFSPEHGFRSDQPAGAAVVDEVDPTTGLPVFSLYGDTYKPTAEMLSEVDVLVYDLQDVGARYYTYISTLGLAMQAAEEAGIEVVVLDRPNPVGGQTISGAVAPENGRSLVSRYPIPSLFGMTVGELAQAIVAEDWMGDLSELNLTVVPMQGWERKQRWDDTGLPWTPPSPGLPTSGSALSYPSIVLFEATTVSYGQGTARPFSQVGAPWIDAEAMASELNAQSSAAGMSDVEFVATTFTPQPTPSAPEPRFSGQTIPGVALDITGPNVEPSLVALQLLAAVQAQSPDPIIDRSQMFDLLAGSPLVRQQLQRGVAPAQIAEAWSGDLEQFDALRQKYLLYE